MKSLLQNLFRILIFATFSLSLTAEPSKTPLPLAGIAVQEKLRVPIFYAAVFSQHYSDSSFKTNQNFPVRMEVRYIQDKFSKRQNHQLWIERILINTPRSELDELSQELLEFSRLMKHEMKKGDQLVFDYFPGAGTRVILNEVLITTFKNFEFQKALTAIWFGKRPPTIVFQQQLLSKPNEKLVKEFNQLTFDASRKREIASIYNPTKAATKKAQTNTTPPKDTPTKVAKAEQKSSVTKQPQAKKQAVSKQPPPKKAITSKKNEVKKATDKKTVESQTPAKTSNQLKEIVREKPAVEDNKDDSTKQIKSNRAATTFDQIILEMKDDYVEEVRNYIESKARPIPPRKVRRKPKSDARILVSFAEKAGAIEIINSQVIDGEFQPELVEVLHQSIRELKKIPLMPSPINDQELTVEVKLSFSKCKRTPSAWLCF